ncbi:GTP 3',8-cyclase [bacterium HR23]|nr:GTP 3',8-cyclase [bacterium HR23]
MTETCAPSRAQFLTDRLGRPLRDLRISITDRCNFRCPFCMPHEALGFRYRFLPREDILTFEETARLVRIFVSLGVRKVRLTGGEPLLRNQVEKLIAQLSAIPGVEDLALTTNGFLLAQKARALKDAGLHRVTVSLHSLDAQVFGRMNGRGFGPQRVIEGIEEATRVGLGPVKVNVVVQRGVNDEEVVALARFCKERGYIIRFIEYMDVGSLNHWRLDDVVSADEILQRLSAVFPLEPLPRGYGDTALRYRYRDGGGEVGVIASVTKPFCGDCTRLRLSAEGKAYTCLFATEGYDLKALLRSGASDEEVRQHVIALWRRRTDRYSEERARKEARPARKVEMFQVGG